MARRDHRRWRLRKALNTVVPRAAPLVQPAADAQLTEAAQASAADVGADTTQCTTAAVADADSNPVPSATQGSTNNATTASRPSAAPFMVRRGRGEWQDLSADLKQKRLEDAVYRSGRKGRK